MSFNTKYRKVRPESLSSNPLTGSTWQRSIKSPKFSASLRHDSNLLSCTLLTDRLTCLQEYEAARADALEQMYAASSGAKVRDPPSLPPCINADRKLLPPPVHSSTWTALSCLVF
eukprot:767589-Hanusia_phi.AAC.1